MSDGGSREQLKCNGWTGVSGMKWYLGMGQGTALSSDKVLRGSVVVYGVLGSPVVQSGGGGEPHLGGDTALSPCSRRTPTPAGCPGDLTPTTVAAA